jgi:predicted O-linked N-acetylglucosamine transferase (SPINDLY family)
MRSLTADPPHAPEPDLTSPAPPWLLSLAWQRASAALKGENPAGFVDAVEELLAQYPDDPILLYNSAVVSADLGRLDEAVARYDTLRRVAPAMRPRAVCGLLRAAQLSGSFESTAHATAEAVTLLEQQLDAIDDVPLLKYFAYRRVFTPALDRFGPALGRRIALLLGAPALPAPPIRRERGRRLTIGYLSWGFGDHPIGHVTQDLFAAHGRDRFRILGFSGRDRGAEAAPYARKIRASFDTCHEIGGLAPVEAARRIRAESVDILVALDQHMAWDGATSAPEILAHRPAPLQVSWLGVAASAHLPFIDCLLADAVTVPAGEDALFAERIIRLPGCFHCASPHPIGT